MIIENAQESDNILLRLAIGSRARHGNLVTPEDNISVQSRIREDAYQPRIAPVI